MGEFDQYDRRSPGIPGNTCPAIDAAIDEVGNICGLLEDITARGGPLERLRIANEDLRECGKYWRDAARDLGEEVDSLTRELEALKDDHASLTAEFRSVERVG